MSNARRLKQLIRQVETGANPRDRASAINHLSLQFLSSDNPPAARVIARFVRDESAPDDLRLFAYLCLLDVSKRSVDDYPDLSVFRFPEDVDWAMVDDAASHVTITDRLRMALRQACAKLQG